MRMTTRLPLAAALFLATTASPVALAAFQVDGKPKVSFFAEGSPGALDIEGKTTELKLEDDGTTLTFTVPLDSVTTGIGLRDTHMKDKYLETGTYPNATLTLKRSELQLPADGETTTGTVGATFDVHGVQKPVTVAYELKLKKGTYSVDATFEYDASAHGIAIPSYLGVTVAPKQSAQVRFDMVDQ